MDRTRAYWKNKPLKKLRIIGVLVLITLLAVRYGLWVYVDNTNRQTAVQQFDSRVSQDLSEFNSQLAIYTDTLYSARALLLVKSPVTRADWLNFSAAQNIIQRYPAAYGLAYVRVINRSLVPQLTAQLNANRLPSETKPVAIYPASTDPTLAVLTYIAPLSASQQVIGYDLLTSPPRSQALQMARDSGQPTASVPLDLVADMPKNVKSFLMVMPIYANQPVATIAQRRAALTGYAVLALHVDQLLDPIFNVQSADGWIALQVRTAGQLLYQTTARPVASGLSKQVTVTVAGQPWQLDFSAPLTYGLSRTGKLAPTLLLYSSIFYAFLLLSGFYLLIRWQNIKQHRQL